AGGVLVLEGADDVAVVAEFLGVGAGGGVGGGLRGAVVLQRPGDVERAEREQRQKRDHADAHDEDRHQHFHQRDAGSVFHHRVSQFTTRLANRGRESHNPEARPSRQNLYGSGEAALASGCTPMKPVCDWMATRRAGIVVLFVLVSHSTQIWSVPLPRPTSPPRGENMIS